MAEDGCEGCRGGRAFDAPIAMAFQPIVDLAGPAVFAYEALVRGPAGEGAPSVLAQVDHANRYGFDQLCRRAAIETATGLGLGASSALLSINFMPNAVYEPSACIRTTVKAARTAQFPLERLIFEFTEGEPVEQAHLGRILSAYKALGFKTAIDDFGAGYSGLTLLAKFQPDIVKLDMELVRDLDTNRVKRLLVGAMVKACAEIGVTVVAEGIETPGECTALIEMGVTLQQGFLFARPGFRCLPEPAWPSVGVAAAAAA